MRMSSQTAQAKAKARAQRHLSRSAGMAVVILPMPTMDPAENKLAKLAVPSTWRFSSPSKPTVHDATL